MNKLQKAGFHDPQRETELISLQDVWSPLLSIPIRPLPFALEFLCVLNSTVRLPSVLLISIPMDIRRFDIYRKVPKDLTQPTLAGAVISILCVIFISFMIFNDIMAYIFIDVRSEMFVDDPGREGKIDVSVNVSLPFIACDYLGVDIQDENGRHEVGFKDHTSKIPIHETGGCRFESKFEINKVPGNFHLSTHSAASQPENPDMRHIIHSVTFGDDVTGKKLKGSFDPLRGKSRTESQALTTHEYILKIVPSVYEDIEGDVLHSYQYTFGHKEYLAYHHTGKIIPAIWFKYELQPITVKHTEVRQSFYIFLTSICAVVGGTFTVAGIIDSTFFTLSEILQKHQIGKLS